VQEPRWLSRMIVDVIHFELLTEHGGAPGTRQGGSELVESALARPQQRLAYDPEADRPSLAAAYLFGLAKNHGYVDGNKRVAFAAAATFLLLNGVRLTASEVEAYDVVIGTLENRYSEEELAAWLRAHSERVS
jgi:death on curing protein